MGRRRRQQRKEDRQTGTQRSSASRYQMRQKLVAIGDDFFIENDQGQKAFEIENLIRNSRYFLSVLIKQGNELCKIQERKVRFEVCSRGVGPGGERLAMVKKALITPVRDRWTVKIGGGPDLDVQGNILDHEYRIGEGRHKVGEVSKKWFRVRDSYGVEVAEGQNDALILAVTVAVDMMR